MKAGLIISIAFLIHDFFFPATAYTFLGFQIINDELHAVVKQEFILSNENTDLETVKEFLEYNGFRHKKTMITSIQK